VCRSLPLVLFLGLALCTAFERWGGGAGGGVEAEDAEVAGGHADFGEGGFELERRIGFDVEEELVFPGTTVDGAAFDFLQVDAVFCKRLERGEERAGAVGEAHGDGHFASVRWRQPRFVGGAEEDEASEIFGVVLKAGGENDAVVVFGGAAAGDGCGSFVAAGEGFADAAGGVFGGDALEMRMCDEESFALREGHGMRGDGADVAECGAGAADEVMLDGEDGFGDDGEGTFEEEIVDADDWTRERVFDGGKESIGEAIADGAEGGVEGGARDRGDGFAEELDGGFFAEGAGLALKGDAQLWFAC
jgi:hypothetical protein